MVVSIVQEACDARFEEGGLIAIVQRRSAFDAASTIFVVPGSDVKYGYVCSKVCCISSQARGSAAILPTCINFGF